MHVQMYGNSLISNGDAAPIIAVRATSDTEAQRWYQQMKLLQRCMRPLGGGIADDSETCKVSFCLRPDADTDEFDFGATLTLCSDADAAVAQRTIVAFVRSHLLSVWRAISPELSAVHGRLYVFDPFIKDAKADSVNTRWHQDGYSLITHDDFFAHFYLPDDAAAGSAATDWCECALPTRAERDWCEVGVLPTATAQDALSEQPAVAGTRTTASLAAFPASAEATDDEDCFAIDWSGLSDDRRIERIVAANFLPLSTASHRLIILHDAEAFHRVPLTALFRRPRRAIVRIEFHGVNLQGEKLYFAPSHQPRDAIDAKHQHKTAADAKVDAAPWRPLERIALPHSLAALCDEYAASGTDAAAGDALDAYIGADAPFKRWLENSLRRQRFEVHTTSAAL